MFVQIRFHIILNSRKTPSSGGERCQLAIWKRHAFFANSCHGKGYLLTNLPKAVQL